MPRGPRLDAPGTLHHVMARGLDRQSIFRDNRDREDFLQRLRLLEEAGAFTIYAWASCRHIFTLLVRTGNRPLPRFMRSLLTGYAGVFNRRHRRAGHLFQNRYRSSRGEEGRTSWSWCGTSTSTRSGPVWCRTFPGWIGIRTAVTPP